MVELLNDNIEAERKRLKLGLDTKYSCTSVKSNGVSNKESHSGEGVPGHGE